MKPCQTCGQTVSEEVATCPSCGREVGEGRTYIDDYRVVDVSHESRATLLCRARRERTGEEVMIRLFKPEAGVSEDVAERLRRELEELKTLPPEDFVRHHAIRRSSDGLWYRISEWIDHINWGDLVASGRLGDYRVAFDLFAKIASILDVLHRNGRIIPHLILDDLMVMEGEGGELCVKVDYKLSRFLDPKMDQPGPMLKHLLDSHPDIIERRPLDFRSDIWSLGKVFLELLTAEYETSDYLGIIDRLALPLPAKILLRTMLAQDPDLRPRSMKEIAEALRRIATGEWEREEQGPILMGQTLAGTIKALRTRLRFLTLALVLVIGTVVAAWFYLGFPRKDDALTEAYVNQYARSMGFVVVDYRLKEGKTIHYRNRAEGTAFLVDREGYLLTSRHVACPWLEDNNLWRVTRIVKSLGGSPEFEYRIFLWFEGQKAFKRSAALVDGSDPGDAYYLESAYRTDGSPRLSIVGVAKPLSKASQVLASPLRDDFAVLKVEGVPEGLAPLPLDEKADPLKIPRLTPIITLGFPLGSKSQADTVNVSVGRGHVRRSFQNLIQVDASIYGGSSGGPLLDLRGKVIGIATGVATDIDPALPMLATPLWNIAMVLPIAKPAAFLNEIRQGEVKWDGVPDLSAEAKIRHILDAASSERWEEAAALSDKALKSTSDPALVLAGAMMRFCRGDEKGARDLFARCLSVDRENYLARFMLFLLDWVGGGAAASPHRLELLGQDWRSEQEFFGYLTRFLEGAVKEAEALKGWETDSERSWLSYIAALIRLKQGEWSESERLLRESIMAAEGDAWEYFLARAKLGEASRRKVRTTPEGKTGPAGHQAERKAFEQAAKRSREEKASRKEEVAKLSALFMSGSSGGMTRLDFMEELYRLSPNNRDLLMRLAFYSAMEGAWEKALGHTRTFLQQEGRLSAGRLSLGILEGLLLHRLGRAAEAQAVLEDFASNTGDPWYKSLSECLIGKRTQEVLLKEAEGRPESLVTGHMALGFLAEGQGNKEKALEHYRTALESFMDTRVEFDFARVRISSLREESG